MLLENLCNDACVSYTCSGLGKRFYVRNFFVPILKSPWPTQVPSFRSSELSGILLIDLFGGTEFTAQDVLFKTANSIHRLRSCGQRHVVIGSDHRHMTRRLGGEGRVSSVRETWPRIFDAVRDLEFYGKDCFHFFECAEASANFP